jgi:cyclophilin family peptidyl-prolyl cis-trans isomerase
MKDKLITLAVILMVVTLIYVLNEYMRPGEKTTPQLVKDFSGESSVKAEGDKKLTATVETNMGTFSIELFPEDAPGTVENFVKLARKGFYDGTIFHRVIDGFMIQGGDPTGTGTGGPGYSIKAEFNKRKHVAGTVAMARSADPDSAGSQFYVCVAPASHLDEQYTVFGQVTDGLDVVLAIGKVDTGRQDRPLKDVVMNKVTIKEATPKEK